MTSAEGFWIAIGIMVGLFLFFWIAPAIAQGIEDKKRQERIDEAEERDRQRKLESEKQSKIEEEYQKKQAREKAKKNLEYIKYIFENYKCVPFPAYQIKEKQINSDRSSYRLIINDLFEDTEITKGCDFMEYHQYNAEDFYEPLKYYRYVFLRKDTDEGPVIDEITDKEVLNILTNIRIDNEDLREKVSKFKKDASKTIKLCEEFRYGDY